MPHHSLFRTTQARPMLSADGRFISFETAAKDISENDIDSAYTDVFLRDTLRKASASADIAITATAPASAIRNQAYAYLFTVSNQGAAIASQTNTTLNLPGSLTIGSVTPSKGNCVKGMVTVCRLGSLGVGASATIQVAVTPLSKGSVSVAATAESVEKDTTYSNNSVTKIMTVD